MNIIKVNTATFNLLLDVNFRVQEMEELIVLVSPPLGGTEITLPPINDTFDSRLTIKICHEDANDDSPILVFTSGSDIMMPNDSSTAVPPQFKGGGNAVITLIPSARTWLFQLFLVPTIP
jgi:hypothetical protein